MHHTALMGRFIAGRCRCVMYDPLSGFWAAAAGAVHRCGSSGSFGLTFLMSD